jgi:hypothetical protein
VSAVARLVRDGYAVDVLDTDGTVLAERIDGGDMAEVEAMLAHFAIVTARREDTLSQLPRLFAGITTGPLVLVVGRFDPADAEAIGAVAHHSTLPLLLTTDPRSDALERAADHGWHVASVTPDGDLGPGWASAVGRGAQHVLG